MSAAVTISPPRAEGHQPPAHRCPRCGYELSGSIASWRDACPLRGTCSECGVEFEWRRMFAGEGLAPSWSFEHGEPTWGRLLGTMARGVLPWMLWRGVPIECPVRPRRLAVLVLALTPLVHVMGVAAVLLLDPISTGGAGSAGSGGMRVDQLIAENVEALITPFFVSVRGVLSGIVLAVTLLSTLFMPLAILLLGETLKRARLRTVHVVRGYCWSWISGMALSMVLLAGAAVVAVLVRRGTILAGDAERNAYLVVAAPFPVWLWAWWYGFTRWYLRLPHAFWVVTLLWVMTLLATSAATWLGVEAARRLLR